MGARLATWPVVELVASIAAQLVLTPFLLHRLSTPQFGVWVIAQSMLLASATLSLGAGTALLPTLASAKSREDAFVAWSAIRTFVRRTIVASLVLFGALCLATAWLGVPPWAPDRVPLRHMALASATLAWLVATELDSGFSSALKALGRFPLVAQLEVASRTTQIAVTLAFVAEGDVALVPIGIAGAVTAAKAALKFWALRRHWPEPGPGDHQDAASSASREIRSSGAWVWLGVVSGLMFNAFDRWFIGAWLGSSVLASYAICSQIAQVPHAFVAAAGQTLVPWAAEHRRDLASNAFRVNARRTMALATAAASLPSVLLLLVLGPLLSLWMSPQFAAEHLSLARALVVVFLLLSLNVPSYFLLFGFGEVRVPTILVGVAGAIFVFGCVLMPPSLTGFVAMKGVFAILTLGLVSRFLMLSRVPNSRAA